MNVYQIIDETAARDLAEIARGSNWATGKARTKALTGTVKQNSEILTHPKLTELGKLLLSDPAVQINHIPLQLHPMKFSRYQAGQHYKMHTDSPWMGATRTDLSCTMWLNDEYEGGELCIGKARLKGKPGQAVIYPCGELHEVTPVTSGERICAITWIQSRVRDAAKRKMLSDMRKFLATFENDKERFLEGGRLYSALMRRWME